MTKTYTGNPKLDEIILRELRYGQTRWTEVWLACIMVAIGITLLNDDDTFSLPSWRFIALYVSEGVAGTTSFLVGLVRLGVIWRNGRSPRGTPIIRIAGCAGGFLFFSALAIGFFMTPGPITIGVGLFSVLAFAELHASGRAARDAFAYDSFRTRERRRARERSVGVG